MSKVKDYNSINWNDIFTEDTNSSTGLRWKISPARRIKAGDVAGSIWTSKEFGRQCFVVKYDKVNWLVHRILWRMRNNYIESSLDIDHIDGNSLNNSVENLRLVSTTSNSRNCKQHRDNSSGITGVSFWLTTHGTTYARAYWYNLKGKQQFKSFPVPKYGLLESFAMACAYREQKINELNESGAGYSERHGTQ